MKELCEFLKACGAFFVLTIKDDVPAGRPFGAVMEYENHLYLSTEDRKDVYQQLKAHPQMQIVALKPGTRTWVRISGIAEECASLTIKQKMLEACPVLTKHFPAADASHFAVFQITVLEKEYH
ncbi:MAG: pyridoxamine 5'-phosphate oxidase family protein [Peptococcaceae bacterium]